MGPQFNTMQFAMMMLQRNPQIANTPQGRQFMQILQSGDAQAGAQMAQNICGSMGKTPQQAAQEAFNSIMGGMR